jgi:hypothetical protein
MTALMRRRGMMQKADRYTPLEYFQFSAGQYIDTGIVFSPRMVMEIKMEKSPSYSVTFGDDVTFFNSVNENFSNESKWFWTGYEPYSRASVYTFVIDAVNGSVTGTGRNRFSKTGLSYVQAQKSFRLGASYSTNPRHTLNYNGKFYYLTTTENGILTHSLIPVSDSSGTEGLLDEITGEFITPITV